MPGRWNDELVERVIGSLLRFGVLLAAMVVLGGGIALLVGHGGQGTHYAVFRGEPSSLRSIPAIAGGAFGGDPRSIVQFGLLLLIATPVARVAFSVVAFWLEKDRMYVAITAVVLAVLVFSLTGGYRG